MKLVTFAGASDAPLLGVMLPTGLIVDLAEADHRVSNARRGAFASMQALIEAGEEALDLARSLADEPRDAVVDPATVRLMSPLPQPVQMRDTLSFEEHYRNAIKANVLLRLRESEGKGLPEGFTPPPIPPIWYNQPIYYKCNRFAASGTGSTLVFPDYCLRPDYELELAVVIGRGGRDITVEDAPNHIFGYTIFNDFTARDAQSAEMEGRMGPAKGKDFDGSNVLGPCIVTADELPNPYKLRMQAWVNGELWSDGNSGTIHWSFEQIIEHISHGETLYPGEVIGSGTVGNGCGLEQLRFLADRDIVELEIEGIGRLTTYVSLPHLAERAREMIDA